MTRTRNAERDSELQAKVLDLVHQRVPESDFAYVNRCMGIMKRRRDMIRDASGRIGESAKVFWHAQVLPQIIDVGGGSVQIPASVMDAAIDTVSVSESPNSEAPNRPVVGFSDKETLTMRDLEKITLIPPGQRGLLIGFYSHDRYYAYPRAGLIAGLETVNYDRENREQPPSVVQFKDFEHLRSIFENFTPLVALARFPHDFMAATLQLSINRKAREILADIKTTDKDKLSQYFNNPREQRRILGAVEASLTAPVDEEDIDIVKDIVNPVSRLIGMRFIDHDYHFSAPEGDSGVNTISVKTSGTSPNVRLNFGLLTSVVYNLAKNSVKAIDAGMREQAGEDTRERYPFSVRYKYARQDKSPQPPEAALTGYGIEFKVDGSNNYTEITVSDRGTGLNTDKIMQQAARIVSSTPEPVQKLATAFIDKDTIRALRNWPDDDFVVRSLALGNVWDLIALPRLSGFGQGSGLGIWGISHLINEKGGSLQVANRFDKGASFRVRIPLSPPDVSLQKAN